MPELILFLLVFIFFLIYYKMRSFIVEKTFEGEHVQNIFKVVLDGVKMSNELVDQFVTNVYYSLRHGIDGDVDIANWLTVDRADDAEESAWFTYKMDLSDDYNADEELDYFLDWFEQYIIHNLH